MAKLTDFTPDLSNANRGTERGLRALDDSIAALGLGRSIVVDRNGVVICGNKTHERSVDRGIEDAIVVKTHGQQLVVVQRDDLDLSDPDPQNPARMLAYADNRVGQLDLDWNAEQLLADVDAGMDLSALFRDDELDTLLQKANIGEFYLDKQAKLNPRKLPLDVIYTLQMADCTCCLAVQAGLKYGIQSGSYRICPYCHELSERHEVAFIDNDYFNYEHQTHLDCVRQFRPKYATVRDVMSKEQCESAGIAYYPF